MVLIYSRFEQEKSGTLNTFYNLTLKSSFLPIVTLFVYQGPQGIQGIKGGKGNNGAKGDKGWPGMPGLQGRPGPGVSITPLLYI